MPDHAVSASIALLIHLQRRGTGEPSDPTVEWLETHSHFQGDAGEGGDRNYIVLIPLGEGPCESWLARVEPPADLRDLFADTRKKSQSIEGSSDGLSYFEVTLMPKG